MPIRWTGVLRDILPVILEFMHPIEILLFCPHLARMKRLTKAEKEFYSSYLPGDNGICKLAIRIGNDRNPRWVYYILDMLLWTDVTYQVFCAACCFGCVEVAEKVLSVDGMIDPESFRANFNRCLTYNQFGTAKLLLDRWDIVIDSWSLLYVSNMGYTGIFKLLLERTHIHDADTLNVCFRNACGSGRIGIVKYLLYEIQEVNDIYADFSVHDTAAAVGFVRSCTSNHVAIAKILLNSKYHIDHYEGLKAALEYRSEEVAVLLIDDGRVLEHENVNLSAIFAAAVKISSYCVINAILEQPPPLNLSQSQRCWIRVAIKSGVVSKKFKKLLTP